MNQPAYKRILLKLSGEALLGELSHGVDPKASQAIASSVQNLVDMGVQVGIVVGAGNFFRGIEGVEGGMARVASDQMGMLATVMNGIALSQAFEKRNCPSQVLSALSSDGFVEKYSQKRAKELLLQGVVTIFVGGTGNPFFTTDSAAALRALEIGAEILLKCTKVDGVYNKDPVKSKGAKKYDRISYDEVLKDQLKVMDGTAIALCRDNGLPIRVFSMQEGSLKKAVLNQPVGTIVTNEGSV